jgi:hypothetical protein
VSIEAVILQGSPRHHQIREAAERDTKRLTTLVDEDRQSKPWMPPIRTQMDVFHACALAQRGELEAAGLPPGLPATLV